MKRLLVVVALLVGCGGANAASVPDKLDLPIPPGETAAPAAAPAPSAMEHPMPSPPARPPGVLEGFVDSGDRQPIHYLSYGAGDAAVVFVHCWGCNLHYWDGAMRRMKHDYRVVALDLPGFGLSGKKRAKWTVHGFAEDVRTVVDKLGLKKVLLVGHSMSGAIILEAGALMPEKVVGLIPIDTLHDVEHKMAPDKRKAFFDAFRKDFAGSTTKIVRSLFQKTADPALVDWVVADELPNDPKTAIPIIEDNFGYDEAAGMDKIKVPIIAINADLYPTSIENNRKHAPQFDARIVEGTGHWLMFDAPGRFEDALVKAVMDEHFGGP